MLLKKQHASIFVFCCMPIMLLLLGLYLLGIGYSGSEAVARSADLAPIFPAPAPNTAKLTSQSGPDYRHPINYYKLTSATSNQIDVLDARDPASSDYPIDHYQQHQREKQQHFAEPDLYWLIDTDQPPYSAGFSGLAGGKIGRMAPPPLGSNHLDPESQHQQVNLKLQPQPQQHQLALSTTSSPVGTQMPICATRQTLTNLASRANSTADQTVPEVLFCNEDSEYPTKAIMRALEAYAAEQSIEQLLPQLFQIHQITDQQPSAAAISDGLDPLQSVGSGRFPSNDYESMCRSSYYFAQPRRALNLLGQWKVVVNLPGHKYRGTAVTQMIRVEECLRPGRECNKPSVPASALGRSLLAGAAPSVSLLPKSGCLQHYESQRLVAWSQQTGLHLDIFRVPIACSCHIRR